MDEAPPLLRGRTVTLRALALADAGALALAASESRDEYGYTRVPDSVEGAQRYIDASPRRSRRRSTDAVRDRVARSRRRVDELSGHPAVALARRIAAPANRLPGFGGDRLHLARRLGPAHAVQHGSEVSAALPRLRRLARAPRLPQDRRAQHQVSSSHRTARRRLRGRASRGYAGAGRLRPELRVLLDRAGPNGRAVRRGSRTRWRAERYSPKSLCHHRRPSGEPSGMEPASCESPRSASQ